MFNKDKSTPKKILKFNLKLPYIFEKVTKPTNVRLMVSHTYPPCSLSPLEELGLVPEE
jgi:hypothetical protein